MPRLSFPRQDVVGLPDLFDGLSVDCDVNFTHPSGMRLKTYKRIKDREDTASYLSKVGNNIQVEYYQMLKKISSNPHLWDEEPIAYRLSQPRDISTEIIAYKCIEKLHSPDAKVEPDEFHDHLVLVEDGKLALLSVHKIYEERKPIEFLQLGIPGQKLPGLPADFRPLGDLEFVDLEYIGSFRQEQRGVKHAAKRLMSNDLLHAIADPTRRKVVSYQHNPLSHTIPHNEAQEAAVYGLKYNIEAIQGPPGTGKSTVIFHIVNSAISPDAVVLATAVQNKAIDAIAEKLEQAEDIPFIVYGRKDRLSSLSKRHILEEKINAHPGMVQLLTEKSSLAKLHKEADKQVEQAEQRHDDEETLASLQAAAKDLFNSLHKAELELQQLKDVAARKIVEECRVVLCTISMAGGLMSGDEWIQRIGQRISVAIVDEAGTVPEQKMPVLMLGPSLEKFISIGDHKQLPPFTHMQEPQTCHQFARFGSCARGSMCKFDHVYSDTFRGVFHRLQSALGSAAVPILLKQYRMHPNIADYISDAYYDGQVCTPFERSKVLTGHDARGLYWVNVEGNESGGHSKCNYQEARVVLDLYNSMKEGLDNRSIMVITFYKAQEKNLREQFKLAGIHESDQANRGLRILSVDQSQGSEADVVILSCVRSNSTSIGFLKKMNRVNVAVSRARSRAVIVGNRSTLRNGGSHWTKLIGKAHPIEADALPALTFGLRDEVC